jgi:hypothetical protein
MMQLARPFPHFASLNAGYKLLPWPLWR